MSDLSNWRNYEVLYEYHVVKGWSPERIAKKVNSPTPLIRDYLENRDLLNAEPKEPDKHVCPECGDEFNSVDDWADHHQSEHFSL